MSCSLLSLGLQSHYNTFQVGTTSNIICDIGLFYMLTALAVHGHVPFVAFLVLPHYQVFECVIVFFLDTRKSLI